MKINKRALVAIVCVLAIVLGCLLAAVIWLGAQERVSPKPRTTTQAPTEPTTAQPTTPAPTTPPGTTPAPTTPPGTTPAPTTPAPVELRLDLDPEEPIVTWSDSLTLSGVAERSTLIVAQPGGVSAQPAESGSFACQVPLAMGKQEITLTCGEETFTYRVERRNAMQSFTPGDKTAFHANQKMSIRVMAKENATLKVEFQGKEVAMRQTVDQLGSGIMDGYVLYVGAVGMPSPKEEKNLGKITYTVVCDGITEVYESSDVTCSAKVQNVMSDKSVTPEGYWNVGSGYIVEITDVSVETLTGKGSHDRSDPTTNYLPKGTVDYGSEGLIINEQNKEVAYRYLRCGVRVYNGIKNTPNPNYSRVVDCYYGTLPDHNEITVADFQVEGHHTYLTLDVMWKAPFFFDYEEQAYEDVAKRHYFVEEFTSRYVDITFCYADRIGGELNIGADHPLFQKAEVIKNTSDYTLRLWLKQPGRFYGWDAYYNEQDQLVFQFLNPVAVTKADNAYGADLTGVTIMLDIGHGGEDIGAAGRDSKGLGWTEKERNLVLANLVRKELESMGATVVMNRTTPDEILTQRERIQYLKQVSPDYCMAIHHNANPDPEQCGYEAATYYPWDQRAVEFTVEQTQKTGLYQYNRMIWFPYYVSRQTVCPIVLTENGYMSNTREMDAMLSTKNNETKAKALAQAVANYFLDMNGLYTPPAE